MGIIASLSMQSLYHHAPGRQYKPTRRELDSGKFECPTCRVLLVRVTRRARDPIYSCGSCGWSIARSDIFDPAVGEQPELRTDVEYGEGIVGVLKMQAQERSQGWQAGATITWMDKAPTDDEAIREIAQAIGCPESDVIDLIRYDEPSGPSGGESQFGCLLSMTEEQEAELRNSGFLEFDSGRVHIEIEMP